MSEHINYTGKPAAFIAVSHLGLVLDLDCLSEYSNVVGDVTWDNEEGLVSLEGMHPPSSIYGVPTFQSNPIAPKPSASVLLSSLQALVAASDAETTFTASLNSRSNFISTSSNDLEGVYIPSDVSKTGAVAAVLYSCVIDNSTILCTAAGISLYNHKREKKVLSITFPLNAACRIEDTIYLGTNSGLYKITLGELFTSAAPQLVLDTTTVPALASNSIASISVDNTLVLISYASSADVFPITLDATPVNLTNIQGVSHLYESRVYTVAAGTAKMGFLPQSSGAVALEDILTTEFSKTPGSSERRDYVGGGFYLVEYNLYNSSEVFVGNLQTISGVNIHAIRNARYADGKLWLMFWKWEADGFSYESYPYASSLDYYVFGLLTFAVTEDTATFIAANGIDSYNNTSSEGGNEDVYDYLVDPVIGPVSKVGDVLTFYATVRDSVERIYYSPTGFSSTSQPESWISKFELNVATGAITKATKILTHIHSEWPVVEWQYKHYLNFSPFIDPGPGLTGVLYASKAQSIYVSSGYYDHEFAKAYRSIMLWDVDSYDEATSTYTQPVKCDHDFSEFLEVDYLLRVDADHFFGLCLNRDTATLYGVLFGNNNALLGETPYFPAIGQPIPLDKFEDWDITRVLYIEKFKCHHCADLMYVGVSCKDRWYCLKITPTGLVLGFASQYVGKILEDGTILATYVTRYTPEHNSMTNVTSLLKGEGIFIIDSGNFWALPSGGAPALILARDVVAAAVSEDASSQAGYITFTDVNKKVLTKPIILETGDWASAYANS